MSHQSLSALAFNISMGRSIVKKQIKALGDFSVYSNTAAEISADPLHGACEHNDVESTRLMLEARANPDWLDSQGRTPLYWACNNGNADLVRLLIKAGASATIKDDQGITPLHMACRSGDLFIIQMLIDAKADVNSSSYDGYTPLHDACINGKLEAAKRLLAYGADHSAVTHRKEYPFDFCSSEMRKQLQYTVGYYQYMMDNYD